MVYLSEDEYQIRFVLWDDVISNSGFKSHCRLTDV